MVLAAGIDVFSTVNVQHLESLNDNVAELTGTRVREIVPDAVLAKADEIVLIDLTAEALLIRLRAGKVYPEERVESALQNFFRIENLQSLRELALRQVAEEVESKRFVERAIAASATRRRPDGSSSPTRRRRSASGCSRWSSRTRDSQRLDPPRLALGPAARHRARPALGQARAAGRREVRSAAQLEAMRRLASVLGAHLLVEEGDELVATVRRVARRARHDLRAARAARRDGRARPVAGAVAAAAARGAPGRRCPDRRRPDAPVDAGPARPPTCSRTGRRTGMIPSPLDVIVLDPARGRRRRCSW